MAELCEVAVIGAGPYGLSIAAHLAARNIPHRIFGKPMDTWATQMPKGMLLKSEGFATSLYDPARSFTFSHYCRERNVPYADLGIPPRVEDFVDYGRAFQRRFAPHLEEVMVKSLGYDGGRYRLQLETGADCLARAVVVAAGISHFATVPKALADAPQGLVTHTSQHHDLSAFKGRKVAVIGAGASAADVAGLLHEAGAEAHLIARGSQIPFHTKMRLPRPLYDQLRSPSSKIGPGWRSVFFTKLPHLFRRLPEATRLRIVRTYLGSGARVFHARPGYWQGHRSLRASGAASKAQRGRRSLDARWRGWRETRVPGRSRDLRDGLQVGISPSAIPRRCAALANQCRTGRANSVCGLRILRARALLRWRDRGEHVRSGGALCLRRRVCGSPCGATFEPSAQAPGVAERRRIWSASAGDGANRRGSRKSHLNLDD